MDYYLLVSLGLLVFGISKGIQNEIKSRRPIARKYYSYPEWDVQNIMPRRTEGGKYVISALVGGEEKFLRKVVDRGNSADRYLQEHTRRAAFAPYGPWSNGIICLPTFNEQEYHRLLELDAEGTSENRRVAVCNLAETFYYTFSLEDASVYEEDCLPAIEKVIKDYNMTNFYKIPMEHLLKMSLVHKSDEEVDAYFEVLGRRQNEF
jgi:hypothetical protein